MNNYSNIIQNYFSIGLCQKIELIEKLNMGDLRAFLNWVVLEKKYLCVKLLPLSSKQYSKYAGSVPKDRKRREARQPISTSNIEMLLEALKRENQNGFRAICQY